MNRKRTTAQLLLLAAVVSFSTAAFADPSRVRPAAPSETLFGPALRVAVVSDMNPSYGNTRYGADVHRAVAAISARRPDLVLSTGDMVAGQRAGLNHAAMWRAFHRTVSAPLAAAGIPFAVTPGNHDGSAYPAFAGERARYVREWSARRPDVQMVDDTFYPLRYSFRRGPALFISLDATRIGPLDPEQMTWLEEQLRASSAPVKIVFGHMPLHAFTQRRETHSIGDAALEALLLEEGVDLLLSGHHHAYYPGRRGPLRMASMACLGAGPRALIGDDETSERSLLWLELDEGGIRSLEALRAPDFTEIIPRETLPAAVGLPGRRIERDDLEERRRPAIAQVAPAPHQG